MALLKPLVPDLQTQQPEMTQLLPLRNLMPMPLSSSAAAGKSPAPLGPAAPSGNSFSLDPITPTLKSLIPEAFQPNNLQTQQPQISPISTLRSLTSSPDTPAPQLPQAGLRPLVTNPQQQQMQRQMDEYAKMANVHQGLTHSAAPAQGFWQHLARIAEGAGNVAGDVFAPSTMAMIPGTQLNRALEARSGERGLAELDKQQMDEQNAASERNLQGTEAADFQQRTQQEASAAKKLTPLKDARGNIIGFQTGDGHFLSLDDPNLPPDAKAIAERAQPKLAATPVEMLQQEHPNWTAEQIQSEMAKPLTPEQAARLNATWDPALKTAGRPTGQFVAGMPSADANALATSMNSAIGRSQGAQNITIKETSAGNADNARSDRNYQYNSTQLNKLAAPVEQIMQRFGNLESDVAQGTPQADALVAPQLLTVMAGGQGSGLRMNEAEISRIVGGRSAWENLRAAAQHWSADPKSANSITPAQRQQIHALMDAVKQKLVAKEQIIGQANEQLLDTDDVQQQRRIVVDARKQLDAIDSGQAGGAKPGYIMVQLPGHPPGQILEDRKDEFLKKNPGAKVL